MPIWFDKAKTRPFPFSPSRGGVPIPTMFVESGGNVQWWNGNYYAVSKWWQDPGIHMVKHPNLRDFGSEFDVAVFTNTHQQIWTPAPGQLGETGINFPVYMFRFANFSPTKWFIYYFAYPTARIGCIESNTSDPMGAWTYRGQIGPNEFALGAVPFEYGGNLYMVTSTQTGHAPGDHHGLAIQQMSSPTALTTNSWNVLADTDYAWERNGAPLTEVDCAVTHNGKLHVIYSASSVSSIDYAVGRITYDGSGSLTDRNNWAKQSTPILQRTATIYRPGQSFHLKSPDGTKDYLGYVYNPSTRWGSGTFPDDWPRSTAFKEITWDGSDNPVIGAPAAEGTTFPEPPKPGPGGIVNTMTWGHPTSNPATVSTPFSALFRTTNVPATSRAELWINDPTFGAIKHGETSTHTDVFGWAVSTTLGAGTYSLFGRAVHTDGTTVRTPDRTVTVSPSYTLNMVTPSSNTTVTLPFSVGFDASDNNRTTKVELFRSDPVFGSAKVGEATAPTLGWVIPIPDDYNGTWEFWGHATLTDGATSDSTRRTITVQPREVHGGVPAKPQNIVNGGADMGPFITQQIANRQPGETFKLSTSQYGKGVYMLALSRTLGGGKRYSILLKSGVNFDFSDCELRLRAGETWTRRSYPSGTVTAQLADIITNSGRLDNATVTIGCLNGQSATQQGTGPGTGSWMDGIGMLDAHNCVIQGGFGPWSTGLRADGTYAYLGLIKNIMANDGGGGDGEGFFYTFDNGGGRSEFCIARRFKYDVDDGSARSATGGSSNGGHHITHEDIRARWSRAQGMTSWNTNQVTYRRVNSSHCLGTAFRNEYGGGHVIEDCYAHHFGNNAVNLKGPGGLGGPPCGTLVPAPMAKYINFKVVGGDGGASSSRLGNYVFQQNRLTVAFEVVSGQYVRPPKGLLHNADNLPCSYPSKPPIGLGNMQQVGSITPPLPD